MLIVTFLTLCGNWKGICLSHDVTKTSIYCDVIDTSLCERIYRMRDFRVNLLENDFPEIHTKREK